MEEEVLDITKLSYVLYARKSSTDETRQVRSIPDQITDCQAFAQRIGIRIVDVITEERSAKKPNNRPKFTQMLKDIRSGKYDGILAWNPDRLARNMLEGGMLIDMIDTDTIKDLKFCTHHFTKDANGKMLLGMAFVLSKQYSDDLSQKVTRGVRKNFQEGKTPHAKHGYYHDESGLYRPDGKNFELICEAWERRKSGESLESIAAWMNKEGYRRVTKESKKEIDMDMRILTDLFRDPFFYGVLVSATTGNRADLREIYDFQPATTEEVYNAVQMLFYNRAKPYNRRRTTFYPFRAMILCAYCHRNMYPAPSRSEHSGVYLSYRCDNSLCIRNQEKKMKKSIRAIVVLNFIYKLLEDGLRLTEDDYKQYYEDMATISEQKRELLLHELHSKQAIAKNIEREVKERSLKLISYDKETPVWKANMEHIEKLEGQKEEFETEIAEIKKHVATPDQDRLSIQDFLNLAKKAATIVKSGDAIVKDKICRLIFLNLTVDEEKVLSYQAKQPFDRILERGTFASSRGAEN